MGYPSQSVGVKFLQDGACELPPALKGNCEVNVSFDQVARKAP